MISIIFKKYVLLIFSLLNVLVLSLGHAMNNEILLWSALVQFSATLVLFYKKDFFNLMLFYIPWATVLKTKPDTYTFASFIVPVVLFLILTNRDDQEETKVFMGFPLLFITYTLLVKLLNGLALQTSYLLFILELFLIPMYIKKYKQEIHFEKCVIFLAAGMLSASLASNILMTYPHMLKYISIDTTQIVGLSRLSGFNGDPNYYSAQILVSIGSLLLVLSKTTSKAIIALEITVIMALLYFGIQSVSKMFLISLLIVIVLWTINLLIERRSISYKFGIITSAVFLVGIVVINNLFAEQINYYLMRFGVVSNMSTLTTGRSNLWGVYADYLYNHPDKLLFGIGLSQDQVRILLKTNNSHFTPIQITYQVGLMGVGIILGWWVGVYRHLIEKVKLNYSQRIFFLIMGVSVFLPWFSLDILYFQEFFYFTLLFFLARNYLSESV